jgi:hypothetical protein
MTALATLGVVFAFVIVAPASAHSDPCHSRHACPSDHHTYFWVDASGRSWDCSRPGADEYNPLLDTTLITFDGLPYHCRAAGSASTTTVTPPPVITIAPPTSTTTTSTTATPLPPALRLVLPIKTITPGALNAKVRQGTIGRTICKAGWTASIRPSSSYTTALKIKQMPLYEENGSLSQYEEDHLIPLELGGAPRNAKNLWPEPRAQSKQSDPLETKLKRQVCQRTLTLAAARAAILEFKFTHG